MIISKIPGIEPLQVADRIGLGWSLLDVRTDEEFDAGHILGSRHLMINQIVTQLNSVGNRIICVCADGERSWRVTRYLTLQKIDAFNLTGGLDSWAASGLEIVR